jgi:hypothetical protein
MFFPLFFGPGTIAKLAKIKRFVNAAGSLKTYIDMPPQRFRTRLFDTSA